MMGIALASDRFPILKQNNAILAFNEKDAVLPKPTDCIRCGKCVQSCPFSLMPVAIEKAVKLNNTEELERRGVMDCMECGTCAYNCPAHRPLVQIMRQGKSMVRNTSKKQGV